MNTLSIFSIYPRLIMVALSSPKALCKTRALTGLWKNALRTWRRQH